MAVKRGFVPPRSCSTRARQHAYGSGDPADEWRKASNSSINGENESEEECWGAFASGNTESAARRKKMEFIYHKAHPNWQDCQTGRDEAFAGLFDVLNDENVFSKGNQKKKKIVYLPAANRQLDTKVFAGHCREALFVGGDIVGSKVTEGRRRTLRNNSDFVVADAFHAPFGDGSLDAIIDVAGATWYALDTFDREKAKSNLKSLLYGWHRALGRKGAVVLDDFPRDGNGYLSTIRRLEEKCPDIFENVKKGGFYFSVGDYRVAFKARTVEIGGGRAYIFEKA